MTDDFHSTVPTLGVPTIRRITVVRGVVQGVGFRPFVYRLAHEEGLAGFIGNDTDGVTIEVEGPAGAVVALRIRRRRVRSVHAPAGQPW